MGVQAPSSFHSFTITSKVMVYRVQRLYRLEFSHLHGKSVGAFQTVARNFLWIVQKGYDRVNRRNPHSSQCIMLSLKKFTYCAAEAVCRGSCFFGYTAENSHHLKARENCAHLLSTWLASKNRALYSEGRVYKRTPELVASPQSTALHSTGNTSVKNSVTRTKSATTTHVE